VKVLFTGFNHQNAVDGKKQRPYASFMRALIRLHREGGDEVTKRIVVPGEDLSGFDRVYVALSNLCGTSARGSLGALWALINRPDAVTYLDDQSSIAFALPSPCKRIRLGKPWHTHQEEAKPHWEALGDQLESMVKGVKHTLLVPVHGRQFDRAFWGKYSPSPVFINPGAVFKNGYDPLPVSPEQKRRAWVLAGLTNVNTHVKTGFLSWPVETFAKDTKVDESELVEVHYAQSWGLVSPVIPGDRTGWWRARFLFSALAGCVMTVGPREQLWDEQTYPTSMGHVESLSTAELAAIADKQRQEYLGKLPSVESVWNSVKELKEAL